MSLDPTEVAAWLKAHPEFFNEHAEALAEISLVSPHGNRAVSLAERQVEVLREKVASVERKMTELIRFGQENDVIAENTQRLVRDLLVETDPQKLPAIVLRSLKATFMLPALALRIWSAPAAFVNEPWAAEVAADTRSFANSLMTPYCGPNSGFDAVRWLTDGNDGLVIRSVAILPLRIGAAPGAFGLLLLGSPDATRFTTEMGTTYLARIGEIASAALSRVVRA
ncbi:DUF484 family protein [Derxia gummosa]|uniref:DUF484 family protein n=1 Tax=Derxia gummosa DSM 723 TaxID=1121388 RepID=A0A8B6X5Q9_9BURK|nr:DUF484 family protein [Derxia gummosa]